MKGNPHIQSAALVTQAVVTTPGVAETRGFYRRHENILLGALSVSIFLVLWELLPALNWVKPIFTSSPSRIFGAAVWLFQNGFWSDIIVSAQEFALGYGLAFVVAVPLGVALGWSKVLRAICQPFVSALYATPRVALIPLLILWLGIGIGSKVAVVFLGVLFPILINTMAGIRTVDDDLIKCAKAFGASRFKQLTTVALPSTVPYILAGMRLGIGRGLVGIVVGELIASTAGIGHMMSLAGATFQTDKVFVGIIILSCTGMILTALINRIEARFEKWRPNVNA